MIHHLITFQKKLASRIIWPYSRKIDILFKWRAMILSAILLGGMVFGLIALIPAALLIVQEKAWGLALVDMTSLILCIVCLAVHRLRFEFRASVTLLGFYLIGLGVIISVGPLSGGPAWLFGFAILSGVLMGTRAALIAILINTVSLVGIGILVSSGQFGKDLIFFRSPLSMITAGVNFIALNAITAVSVSTLLKGLDTNEKRYSLLANNATDIIWTMDMDLNFTFISPSIQQIQGFTVEEGLKMSINDMLVPDSLAMAVELFGERLKLLESGDEAAWEPTIFEVEQYCKNGSTIWTSIHARIVRGPDSQAAGILGITRDITDQKKHEAEKFNAQAIAAENKKQALVGQVAGKMAHDFNNILGNIMGTTELAQMDCKDEETAKSLKLIFNQTIRGRNLTKNLVAFAKSQEPKQNFVQINQIVNLVLDLTKKDFEHTDVKTDFSSDIPDILVDPGMIEHALINIFQNAIHATGKVETPWIKIRTSCSNSIVAIEIEDNGCGIPEEYLDHIFEPSFTLKGSRDTAGAYQAGIKGTGYGLANVKKYIDQHNGSITVESTVSRGTKFTLQMPVIRKNLSPQEKKQILNKSMLSGKQILLVEDEPAISDVQQRILTDFPLNHSVDIAENGQAAVDLFLANEYDCISLDYILPGKLNGMDVYKRIREGDKSIPILFISGNIEFLESTKSLKQKDPYVDHLSKPAKNIEYINTLNRLLHIEPYKN